MLATIATTALGTVLLLAIGLCGYKALYADTFGLDRMLAAGFFGAKHGETISLIVAQWNAAGSRAGCRWCWFLSKAVERDHCAKQLDPTSPDTPLFNGMRAGLCLVALAFVLVMVPYVLGSVGLMVWEWVGNS